MNLDELKRLAEELRLLLLEHEARIADLERRIALLQEGHLENTEDIGRLMAESVRASERPTEPAPHIPGPPLVPKMMGLDVPPKRR